MPYFYNLRLIHNLTSVSNICKAVGRSFFWISFHPDWQPDLSSICNTDNSNRRHYFWQFDSDKPWISGPLTLTTDKGTSIETDLVFRCTGLKVNSIAYQSKLSDKMEKNGSLKVDQFLRVEEIENLFAIGDCNNTPELKLAYLARLQAGKIVKL